MTRSNNFGDNPTVTLITVSRDNPQELLKTCRSVSEQTVSPDSYFVVDSSNEDNKKKMEKIARSHGAEYLWVEPRGVYPAMAHSLRLADDDSYVWFINSSDWLAGEKSVQIVKDALALEAATGALPIWLIGQLALEKRRAPYHHLLPTTPEKFVSMLASGRIGFPHPSAIIKKVALLGVGAFEDDLLIASDYAAALRVAQKYGAPLLLPETLSVHVPTGFTSQNRVRHAFEKSLARTRVQGNAKWALEPFRQVRRLAGNWFSSGRAIWNNSRMNEDGYPHWGNPPFIDITR